MEPSGLSPALAAYTAGGDGPVFCQTFSEKEFSAALAASESNFSATKDHKEHKESKCFPRATFLCAPCDLLWLKFRWARSV
jgi:hypothetical protein